MSNIPQVTFDSEEIDNKIQEANLIIDAIELLDNTSSNNLSLVKHLRNRLTEITNSLVDVRIWTTDGILYCSILYPNPNIMKEFRGE